MNAVDKNIVEMRLSEDDEGELHYTQYQCVEKRSWWSAWAVKIIGLALGVAFFLLFVAFFVYVVIPLILILILYSFIRKFFRA